MALPGDLQITCAATPMGVLLPPPALNAVLHGVAMRFAAVVAVFLSIGCGDPARPPATSPPVAVHIAVRNNGTTTILCSAGFVVGDIRPPEDMSEYSAISPGTDFGFVFMVPNGEFATLEVECEAKGYPDVPRYANTWIVTDALTEPLECVATYEEPYGLTELNIECQQGGET